MKLLLLTMQLRHDFSRSRSSEWLLGQVLGLEHTLDLAYCRPLCLCEERRTILNNSLTLTRKRADGLLRLMVRMRMARMLLLLLLDGRHSVTGGGRVGRMLRVEFSFNFRQGPYSRLRMLLLELVLR